MCLFVSNCKEYVYTLLEKCRVKFQHFAVEEIPLNSDSPAQSVSLFTKKSTT
jgi:hypothetical protein